MSIYPKPRPLGSHSQSFPKHGHFPPGHKLASGRLRINATLCKRAASSASAGVWETLDQCVTLQTCYKERTSFVGQAFSLSHPWVFLDEELLLLTLVPTWGFEGRSIRWHCRDVGTQSSKRGCRFINKSWGLPNGLLTLLWSTTFTWPVSPPPTVKFLEDWLACVLLYPGNIYVLLSWNFTSAVVPCKCSLINGKYSLSCL